MDDNRKSAFPAAAAPGTLNGIGDIGGMFEPQTQGMRRPVLISRASGVGAKLRLAFLMDRHDTVGIDCVAMCVNDLICSGAMPIFFSDYIACGKCDPQRLAAIVSGVAEGCRRCGCVLMDGKRAELPVSCQPEEYDLAGFSIGLVDNDRKIDRRSMKAGDVLLGLGSSGVHAYGYALVRKVLDISNTYDQYNADLACTLGEELLKPTRIYVNSVRSLIDCGIDIHGISHISDGGLYENVPRMMPPGLTARIRAASIPQLPIFSILQKAGGISSREMYHTFNMGVGMILAIPRDQVGRAMNILVQNGERVSIIGQVSSGEESIEVFP